MPRENWMSSRKYFSVMKDLLAFSLNTDGIGFSYRAAKRIDYLNKRLFEIEGGTLKHPKEYKHIQSLYTRAVIMFLENSILPFISEQELDISMNFTKRQILGELPSGIFILPALSWLFINQFITRYYILFRSTE